MAVVLLDRDGVIFDTSTYKEPKFINNFNDITYIENALPALALLHAAGHELFVLTNQGGVGKHMTLNDVEKIHRTLTSDAHDAGASFSSIYYCAHRPTDGCGCRKPNIGMVEMLLEDHASLRNEQFYVVGDMTSDILMGENIKQELGLEVCTILVETGCAGLDKKYAVTPDHIEQNLRSVADYILRTHAP